MFNLKITSILVFVLLCSSASFAQFTYSIQSTSAFPSPEATEIGKFVQFPIANRTGIPEIGIPLYQINDRGTFLPISLAYHASGIKVDQLASWVGMGWSLHAGGVITRSVKGLPDDVHRNKQVEPSNEMLAFVGWIDTLGGPLDNTGPANKVQRWPFVHEWTNGTMSEDTAASECIRKVEGPNKDIGPNDPTTINDTEPDIFYIKTPTISAKFIFDSLRVPRLLDPNQNLKIEFATSWNGVQTPPFGYHDSIVTFTVTDANGIQYIFNETESTTSKRKVILYDSTDWANGIVTEVSQYTNTSTMTTAWFLSKIKFMNESEITFTYNDVTQKTSYNRFERRGACTSNGDTCLNNGDCESIVPTNVTSSDLTISTKLIKEIHSPNTKITFTSSASDREDLEGSKSLDSITVYAKHNGEERQVKSFHFNYSYMTSVAIPYDLPAANFKRLFLKSLQENKSSTNAPPPYVFMYDRTGLPHRKSPEQDFWGYYNDNDAVTLIPRIYCYPEKTGADRYRNFPLDPSNFSQNEYIFKGEDRSVNKDVITAGMLTQIKYPTCGTTDYIYEPNDYYDEGAKSNLMGGGVRIREIIKYDGVSHDNDIRKIFTYQSKSDPERSSGLLINKPVFAKAAAWAVNPDDPIGHTIGKNFLRYKVKSLSWCDEKVWNVFTRRTATSYAPLSDIDGIQVSYTNVSIHHEGAGKTSFEYYPPRTYQTHASLVKSGASLDYNNLNKNCSSNDLTFGNIDTTGFNIFPFPPLSQDKTFTWGKLKSQSNYDAADKLVSEKTYDYVNYYLNGLSSYTLYGVAYQRLLALCSVNSDISWNLPRAWSKYTYETDAVAKVSEIREKIYDQELTANFIEKTTNLYYESEHHMLLTRNEIVDSDSTIIRKTFKYAPDYQVSVSDANTNGDVVLWGLNKLTARHHFKPVIEQAMWEIKSGDVARLIDARLSTYNRNGNTALPFEVYVLETTQPLTNFTPSEMNLAKEFISDSRYERKITFERYDGYGNLVHSIDKDGKSISTVWGYNYSLPIATAFNAKRNDPIAFGIPGIAFGYIGFEAKNESSGLSFNDHWDFYQDNDFSSDAHTGEVSRKVTTSYGPTRNFEPENQDQKFILSAWIKTGPSFTQGDLVVYSIDDDGSTTVFPNINEAYVATSFGNTNGEWQYVETIFDLGKIRDLGSIPANEKLRLRCFPWSANNQDYFLVDDIRFSSYHAEVSYSTYEPLVGITAKSNTQDRVNYYTYNDIGQPLQLKNQHREIIQEYAYNYHCKGCGIAPPDTSVLIINHTHDQLLGTSSVLIEGSVPVHQTHWTLEQNNEIVEEVYEVFPVDTFIEQLPTQVTYQWQYDPNIISPCDGYKVNFEVLDECGAVATVKVADYPPTIVPPAMVVTAALKDPLTMVSNVTIAGGIPPYNYEWNLVKKGIVLETTTQVSNQPFDQWQPDTVGIGAPGMMEDSAQYSIFTTIQDYCHQQTETEVLSALDTIEIVHSHHDPTRMISTVKFQKGVGPYQVDWQLIENSLVIEQKQLISAVPENTWTASTPVTQDYIIISTITDANMNQVSKTVFDSANSIGESIIN